MFPARLPVPYLTVRLALVSFLFHFAIDTSTIFLPLYAESLGASRLQVGLMGTSYGLAFFLSAFLFGRQADMRGGLAFIRAGFGLSAAANLLPVFTPDPLTLLAARGAVGFCFGIAAAAAITYTYQASGRLGSIISYGALGSLASPLMAAVLARHYEGLFAASAAASAAGFLVTLTLADDSGPRPRTPFFPFHLIRENSRVYIGFLLRQLGANAVWAVFPLFLASIGAGTSWIAALYGINMAGQFFVMRFIDRFNAAKAFVWGFLLSLPVFISYGLATSYVQLVPFHLVLAVAWPCLYAGAMNYFLRKGAERGTAVGLLYSTIYLSAGIGPAIGGVISEVWGFKALMGVAATLTFAGWLSAKGLTSKP